MIFTFDPISKTVKELQSRSVNTSFGSVRVYQIGGQTIFEAVDYFGEMKKKVVEKTIPEALEQLGLKTKTDTVKDKIRSKQK